MEENIGQGWLRQVGCSVQDAGPGGVIAVQAVVERSRWFAGPEPERGRKRRLARLYVKVEEVGRDKVLHWTLTYARYNVPEHSPARWKADGSNRDAAEWFDLARARRHVGEAIRRLRKRGYQVEYFKGTEFQSDGFVHFHVILCGHRRIPKEVLDQCWPWGHNWITRAGDEALAYASKGVAYAAKGPDDALPEYLMEKSSGTRLNSSSRRFYGVARRKSDEQSDAKLLRSLPSIGEVRGDRSRAMTMRVRLIRDTGELLCRTFKSMDGFKTGGIYELHLHMSKLGYVMSQDLTGGGFVGWRVGEAAAAEPQGLSLDQSPHCGFVSPSSGTSSSISPPSAGSG